jgi:hypothetical protein
MQKATVCETMRFYNEDLELTQDLTLAQPMDYKTYNVNMPIRPY